LAHREWRRHQSHAVAVVDDARERYVAGIGEDASDLVPPAAQGCGQRKRPSLRSAGQHDTRCRRASRDLPLDELVYLRHANSDRTSAARPVASRRESGRALHGRADKMERRARTLSTASSIPLSSYAESGVLP
jgi:hypothetical protein